MPRKQRIHKSKFSNRKMQQINLLLIFASIYPRMRLRRALWNTMMHPDLWKMLRLRKWRSHQEGERRAKAKAKSSSHGTVTAGQTPILGKVAALGGRLAAFHHRSQTATAHQGKSKAITATERSFLLHQSWQGKPNQRSTEPWEQKARSQKRNPRRKEELMFLCSPKPSWLVKVLSWQSTHLRTGQNQECSGLDHAQGLVAYRV